ncbi:hypothetical protein L195_g041251, partial [Trifolium pratense]
SIHNVILLESTSDTFHPGCAEEMECFVSAPDLLRIQVVGGTKLVA